MIDEDKNENDENDENDENAEENSEKNSITPEEKQKIIETAKKYKEKFGKPFNIKRFIDDATKAKENQKTSEHLKPEDYIEKKGGPDFSFGGNLSFSSSFENGKFMAKSPDGQIIEAQTHYELCEKVVNAFKNANKNNDRPTSVYFDMKNKSLGGVTPEQRKKDFAMAAIRNGVIPKGDIPLDKEFWQQMKNEYFSNKENSPEMWEKLTQHIPDNVMGRKMQKGNANSTIKKIERLRGVRQYTPPRKYTPPQKLNANSLKFVKDNFDRL